MAAKGSDIDIVLVHAYLGNWTGSSLPRIKQQISRQFPRSRVATVSYSSRYDNSLHRDVFYSRVEGFQTKESTQVVAGATKESGGCREVVEGNPLQHVATLDYRHDAVKICFLLADAPPFIENLTSEDQQINDEHLSNEQINEIRENNKNTNNNNNKSNTVQHDLDPLLVCHALAAKGVVLYCISTCYSVQSYKDTFEALAYTTGGQSIPLDNTTAVSKVIRNAIVEETSLEQFIGHTRDFLYDEWHRWGRHESRVPYKRGILTENLHNHLQTTGVKAMEILNGKKPLEPASVHSKRIASLRSLAAARKIPAQEEDSITTEAEFCDEVIPGYDIIVIEQSKGVAEVTLSEPKLLSRNQTSRLLVKALSRRTVLQQKCRGKKLKPSCTGVVSCDLQTEKSDTNTHYSNSNELQFVKETDDRDLKHCDTGIKLPDRASDLNEMQSKLQCGLMLECIKENSYSPIYL